MNMNWNRLGWSVFGVVGIAALASCAAQDKASAPASERTSTAEEALAGAAEPQGDVDKVADVRKPTGVEKLVASNNAFAFDLHKTMDGGNLVYSPHSISVALAPVFEGAAQGTREELGTALHFAEIGEGQVAPKFRLLATELAARERRADDDRGFRLKISNAIWAANDLEFVPEFQRLAESDYLMEARRLDFRADSNGAREAINSYVSESTAGKIADLLPSGSITGLTRVVVTNAVYFNAAWQMPFVRQSTADGDFQAGAETVRVPYMSQTGRFAYADADGFKMLELPYVGGDVAAYVILPEEGKFQAVDTSLSPQKFEWMRAQLGQARVDVKLPKFKLRSKTDLNAKLKGMGIVSAFDEKLADFSRMVEGEEIFITDVIHEGFINVDEAGTEAAAATGVVMGTRSMPTQPPEEFHATRPFTFLIVDKPTGAILFVARVTNPAA